MSTTSKQKRATANTQRAIEFDRERLEIVKRVLGDVKLSAITARTIEGFQAKRRLEGASNRTVNMDIGALRQVMKRFEAGEPDHVVESITGHLSRRMLEHYSHIRLNAKKAALDRLDQAGKAAPIKSAK